MFLDKPVFETVIAATPLISIDLIVKNLQGHYLLGYRHNRPAKGYWFVPGGRILKNETMDDAFSRLCEQELGIKFQRKRATFLGPYEHFYDDSVFDRAISTHYIVLGYEIVSELDIDMLPKQQHEKYAWFSSQEVLADANVHQHSKDYIEKYQ